MKEKKIKLADRRFGLVATIMENRGFFLTVESETLEAPFTVVMDVKNWKQAIREATNWIHLMYACLTFELDGMEAVKLPPHMESIRSKIPSLVNLLREETARFERKRSINV